MHTQENTTASQLKEQGSKKDRAKMAYEKKRADAQRDFFTKNFPNYPKYDWLLLTQELWYAIWVLNTDEESQDHAAAIMPLFNAMLSYAVDMEDGYVEG